MKKKILSMVVAAAMTMSLVACGGGKETDTQNMNTETEAMSESVTESMIPEDTEKNTEREEDTAVTEDTTETVENDASNADENTTVNGNSSENKNDNSESNDKPVNDNKDKQEQSSQKPEDNKTDSNADKQNQNTETKPAHTHSYTGKVTKNATCTSKGTRVYSCDCGASYSEDIAKIDHQYDNGKVTTAATCANAGVKTYTCKNCGATRTESISATGHDWKHHKATGHEEQVLVKAAWDETVTEVHTFCNQCGKDFGAGNAGADAAVLHVAGLDGTDCYSYSSKQVTTGTVHHDAVYETKWVQDTAAYDECTKCGARR